MPSAEPTISSCCCSEQTTTSLEPPSARTVADCLERDHRSIDAALTDAEALLREGDYIGAEQIFSRFRSLLDAHIDAEEEVLFPAFEQLTACNGPTSVMRGEHIDIRRLMTAISEILATSEGVRALSLILELARVLGMHNVKEERVLYPRTDAALESDRDREALVSRLEERLTRVEARP